MQRIVGVKLFRQALYQRNPFRLGAGDLHIKRYQHSLFHLRKPPPTTMPRSLVLCFDGTRDSFDDDITNVVRFVEALEKKRPEEQLYYYQPGIGRIVNGIVGHGKPAKTLKLCRNLPRTQFFVELHSSMDRQNTRRRICLVHFLRLTPSLPQLVLIMHGLIGI